MTTTLAPALISSRALRRMASAERKVYGDSAQHRRLLVLAQRMETWEWGQTT